jgi:endonuclease/exonuclease/phosphatase family metal-dependent hydrolase
VMWWNIRDLSSASRDDEELALIAQVIRPAEVCAIGELNEPTVLVRLAAMLGPEWSSAHSPKVVDSSHSAEHYGFLWDSTALRLVGEVQVDHASEATIDREPAWATFESIDGQLDFTLIAVHVTWGHLVSERKAEIRQLPDVWHRVQLATPDDDALILVGDFNRNIGDESFDGLFEIPGMVRANGESPATHISSTSTYDQVFLSTTHTDEWTAGQFELHRFDETVFGGSDQ